MMSAGNVILSKNLFTIEAVAKQVKKEDFAVELINKEMIVMLMKAI